MRERQSEEKGEIDYHGYMGGCRKVEEEGERGRERERDREEEREREKDDG